MSTRGTLSVPKASAATAWAPPILKTRSAPPIFAAAKISGATTPPLAGVTTTISRHPAIFAGTTPISTLEKSGAVPPGT